MSKLIIIDKDDTRELKFEEVLEMYKPMIMRTIYSFRILRMEVDDKYQIACVALCKAYENYDIEMQVGLWALAKKMIVNDLIREINYNERKKRSGMETLSMNRTMEGADEQENSIMDKLQANIDIENDIILRENLNKFMNKITEKQKETISLRMIGKSYKEITKILGIAQTTISMRMLAAKKIFNKCMA